MFFKRTTSIWSVEKPKVWNRFKISINLNKRIYFNFACLLWTINVHSPRNNSVRNIVAIDQFVKDNSIPSDSGGRWNRCQRLFAFDGWKSLSASFNNLMSLFLYDCKVRTAMYECTCPHLSLSLSVCVCLTHSQTKSFIHREPRQIKSFIMTQ